MRASSAVVCCALLAVSATAEDDVAALLRIHERDLRAHREGDVAAIARDTAEGFVSVSNGAIERPSPAEVRDMFTQYLGRTRFTEYRDLEPPIVRVSRDGTVAWMIVRVKATGTQKTDDGEKPIAFTSAWVMLYEKRDGRWTKVANVSTFAR
jgi:ketosteroid isomerase-like protein